MDKDITILRELAKEFKVITQKDIQNERKSDWSDLNSLVFKKPLIYIRAYAINEVLESYGYLKCTDPLFRQYEYFLRDMIFRDKIGDDYIIEPWIKVLPKYITPEEMRWGVHIGLGEKTVSHGSAAYSQVINTEEDINKLKIPVHQIDEQRTKETYDKINNAIGDIVPVCRSRVPVMNIWSSDISTDICKLRGLEQIMWDIYDRPEWLHKVLGSMRDGILKVHSEAEEKGDWSLLDHQNQSMPYAKELKPPTPDSFGAKRKDLWFFMAAQEFTGIGPEQFEEFLLNYQIPILKKFGLTAYGCCEDMTQKIDVIKKIPNLRRIAVTPWSDIEICSEKIGKDHVLSYRPNPSEMISKEFDESYIRSYLRKDFEILKKSNNIFDITLKDVETVHNKPKNVLRWVEIVREEIERIF